MFTKRTVVFAVCSACLVASSGSAQASLPTQSKIAHYYIGPVETGMSVEGVEAALDDGSQIELDTTAGDGSCGTSDLDRGVHGLFTDGILRRVDVTATRFQTIRGVRVGDSVRRLRRRHPRLSVGRHPYAAGRRVMTSTERPRRLRFEISTRGRVMMISFGVIPEIDYYEGCA